MTLKSIAVETDQKFKSGEITETPELTFLRFLHRDLVSFGRDDVSLIVAGDQAVFSWSQLYNRTASGNLRNAVAISRLERNADRLRAYESQRIGEFNQTFDIDTSKIDPVVVDCGNDPDRLATFEYHSYHQSMSSKVARGRFGRFLIYDRAAAGKPLMGIIGLSSPVYFNGARDAHLGWQATGTRIDGQWHENKPEKEKRDRGLLHISHVTISTPVSPYTSIRIGKLLSALCFSPDIIQYMENKYGAEIAGLSTTGGWGINAAPYQRIKLAKTSNGKNRNLFEKVVPKNPSLNTSLDYFSDDTVSAALSLHKTRSTESSAPYEDCVNDRSLRHEIIRWAFRRVGVSRRAAYVNEVGHFFGSVSDDAISFLSDIGIGKPPRKRTIKISDALTYWRAKTAHEVLKDASPSRLTDELHENSQG